MEMAMETASETEDGLDRMGEAETVGGMDGEEGEIEMAMALPTTPTTPTLILTPTTIATMTIQRTECKELDSPLTPSHSCQCHNLQPRE